MMERGGDRTNTQTSSAVDFDSTPTAALFDLVRNGRASTRPELATVSGLGRKAVSQRVDHLMEIGLLADVGLAASHGGRPVRTLAVNAAAGHAVAAIVGSTEITITRTDLAGGILATAECEWDVERGPDETMHRLAQLIRDTTASVRGRPPWAIAVGLPGPVEFSTTRIVAPAIMPGWDGFSPRAWLREHFDAPVWADNHVHLMAMGEWHASPEPRRDMLFIEVGMDVGAGLMIDGRILRGERGGAGAIGHIRVSDDGTPCRCGKTGCLETRAAGWAVLNQAESVAAQSPILSRARRSRPLTLGDVGLAARDGDPVVRSILDRAALDVSRVIADLVTFTNPGAVVLGGGMLAAGDVFLQSFLRTLEDTIGARGGELITDGLVVRSAVSDGYGIAGAGRLALDSILNPVPLARWLPSRTPLAHAVDLQRLTR